MVKGLIAISAILMRDVRASDSAASATGSRRNRWLAIQIVVAPPCSPAASLALKSAGASRPADASEISDKALHRFQNLDVTGAAADIAVQVVTNLLLRGRRLVV